MLALAYAAAHPGEAGALALVGCGTFTPAARARLQGTLAERRGAGLAGDRLYDLDADPPDPRPEEAGPFDERAHTETWSDMLRLQEQGVYPAAFASIRSPVLMLHGAYDPHPGRLIRDGLLPYLPRLEYREWERCGHSPWRERAVREEFFTVLIGWLRDRTRLRDGTR